MDSQKQEIRIKIGSLDQIMLLFGNFDDNVKIIEQELNVKITSSDGEVIVTGDSNTETAATVIKRLLSLINQGEIIDRTKVLYSIQLASEGQDDVIDELMKDVITVTYKGKQIKCKTLGQRKYIDAIKNNTMVFGIGPAGTGKTYLAMAMAVAAYKSKKVNRIVLTRPAVEAGEKLGFLPGDLQNKVDPYLRPLYDALYDLIGMETYQKLVERGIIEVAPLAYMRGRTLDDSFIILDEAQNTTSEQMKMFVTRLGFGSRAVITGDITQIDLPRGARSGLKEAVLVLKDVKDIGIVYLTYKDVVRHELVQNIIKAYDRYEKKRSKEEVKSNDSAIFKKGQPKY